MLKDDNNGLPVDTELFDLWEFDRSNYSSYASELTAYRKEYVEIKAAGFESLCDLLSAYLTLLNKQEK